MGWTRLRWVQYFSAVQIRPRLRLRRGSWRQPTEIVPLSRLAKSMWGRKAAPAMAQARTYRWRSTSLKASTSSTNTSMPMITVLAWASWNRLRVV